MKLLVVRANCGEFGFFEMYDVVFCIDGSAGPRAQAFDRFTGVKKDSTNRKAFWFQSSDPFPRCLCGRLVQDGSSEDLLILSEALPCATSVQLSLFIKHR